MHLFELCVFRVFSRTACTKKVRIDPRIILVEGSYPPGTQAAGIQDLGARMLKSKDLIILSSSIGDLLRCHRPPQGATGRQDSGPARHRAPKGAKILAQNPANLPKSVHPSIQASIPQVLEVGGRGGSLFNIIYNIYIYIHIYISTYMLIDIHTYIYLQTP